jgi:hypothetical protein
MTDLSVDARLLATERGEAPRINSAAAIFASALMAAGALALADHYAWRQGALFLLGGALGLVLYHALFGFTSAWARLHRKRTRRRLAGANGDARGGGAAVLSRARAGRPVRAGARGVWRGRDVRACRRVPVRSGNAARRGLRVGHALYCRRRQFAHAGDARLLHHRFRAWRLICRGGRRSRMWGRSR